MQLFCQWLILIPFAFVLLGSLFTACDKNRPGFFVFVLVVLGLLFWLLYGAGAFSRIIGQ